MNLKLSAAGFAIQTAKGAPKAQPDFWGPVGGGALVTLGVEQAEDELTSAEVGGIGEFRQSVAVAADYETRAWPASIGGLLYAVLGAIESSGGAPAVKAVYTTALAGVNNDLTFLAKTAGVAGNGITVALVNGGSSQPLTVGVVASAITVNLATSSGGAITSTATQVKNAINAKTEAKALITASVAPGNSGAGVVVALAPTNLAGGAAAAGGGTYTHVITAASEVPWATVFGAKDTERKSSLDSKCDELKIEWEANGPLKVNGTWAGCDVDWSDVAYVPGLDESLLDYFKGIHLATTTIDLDGSGYDGGATVLGGSIDIKRNLSADAESGVLLSSGLNEGAIEIAVEIKCRVPNLLPVRLLLTGAVDGEEVTAVVPYGDFTLGFTDPAGNGLSMTASRVAWTTEEPDADPKGGPGELTLKGLCYGPAAADLFEARVVNGHATYIAV